MTATLRQATRDDIEAMHTVRLAVQENVLTSPALIGRAAYVAALEEPGRGWVVIDAGALVAFGVADGASGHIWALFVDPAHHGRGHGRALLDTMLDWLTARGVTRAWLGTDPGTRAERFYRRHGWTPTGPRDGGEVGFERSLPREG